MLDMLLADDHWAFRMGLISVLEQLADEVSVSEAASYEEALGFARAPRHFDLILLDLMMPDNDPTFGLRSMIECTPGTPLVVISMSADQRDILQTIQLGAMGYIPKSASREEVLHALRRVLAGEVWIPNALRNTYESDHSDQRSRAPKRLLSGDVFVQLTQRQCEVLELIGQGKSNAEIAFDLGLSVHTIRLHVSGILKSLGVPNRLQAAMMVANRLAPPTGAIGT